MSKKNSISSEITPEQLQTVKDSIAVIEKTLANVLTINLEPADRSAMLKLGDKTLAFVGKAMEFGNLNAKIVPSFIDFPEAQKDYRLSQDLFTLLQQLNPLVRSMEDAGMVAGSEAFEAALNIYGTAKAASASNTPGVQAVVDELAKRYPNRKRKPAAPEI